MRDDFTKATKRLLARRVGYLCSNPSCRSPTTGPSQDATKAISVGEAAHITAAASGGKRYDSSLTSEERTSPLNGIWLCCSCATLIDADQDRFPTEQLRSWKSAAEALALERIRGESAREQFTDRDRLVSSMFWAIPSRFLAASRFVLFEFRQFGDIPDAVDQVFRVNAGVADTPNFDLLTLEIAQTALRLKGFNLMTSVLVQDEERTPFQLADFVLREVEAVRRQCKELLDRYGAVMTPNYAWRIELFRNRAENLLHLRRKPPFPDIDESGVNSLAEFLVMCMDLYRYNSAVKESGPSPAAGPVEGSAEQGPGE